VYGRDTGAQLPISFSSWMGGDRDGNPFVTPDATREALALHRERARDLLLESIIQAYADLSQEGLEDDQDAYRRELRALHNAVRDGETLQHIGSLKAEMTFSIRQGLLEICKVQGLTVVLLFLFGPRLLEWLGMSSYYLPLFYIDLIGVSIQVVFMAILNVFFYLDKRAIVLELCLLFVALNAILTLLSLHLGPSFFGYGFTLSLLVCVLLGLARLSTALDDLEYETFMLSR